MVQRTEGAYYLDGQLYHMGIHGLAPNQMFHPVEQSVDRLCLELTDTEETYGQYPRHFDIHYVLRENTLEISYEVENRDEKTCISDWAVIPVSSCMVQKFRIMCLLRKAPNLMRRRGTEHDLDL